MIEGKIKEPDRFFIEKSDRKDYDRLKKKKDSPLFGKENKDLFILAVVVGFNEGARQKLNKKEGYFRSSYLDDKDRALINAIAVSEEGPLDVLVHKDLVFSIAEEYANGGIKLLKDKVFSGEYGSFARKLEFELVKMFEERIKKA